MSSHLTLSGEIRKLIEARLEQTLKGIEDTLNKILETQETQPRGFDDLSQKLTLAEYQDRYKQKVQELIRKELQENLKSLEESFNLLFQKWNLEILYTLFFKTPVGFGELKRILGINSRTLSDKLKTLNRHLYIERKVDEGPPLRVDYSLTSKGKNTVLLALPLLYYSSSV